MRDLKKKYIFFLCLSIYFFVGCSSTQISLYHNNKHSAAPDYSRAPSSAQLCSNLFTGIRDNESKTIKDRPRTKDIEDLSPEIKKIFEKLSLPKIDSPKFADIVYKVKSQLEQSRSFAIVDLRDMVNPALITALDEVMKHGPLSTRFSVSRPDKAPESEMEFGIWLFAKELDSWFQSLIKATKLVYVEDVNIANSEMRQSRNGEGPKSDAWHIDGGRAAVTLSFKGPGTSVLGAYKNSLDLLRRGTTEELLLAGCVGCEPFTVPAGHALIFFAQQAPEGFYPTIHATPKTNQDRILFIFRRY